MHTRLYSVKRSFCSQKRECPSSFANARETAATVLYLCLQASVLQLACFMCCGFSLRQAGPASNAGRTAVKKIVTYSRQGVLQNVLAITVCIQSYAMLQKLLARD